MGRVSACAKLLAGAVHWCTQSTNQRFLLEPSTTQCCSGPARSWRHYVGFFLPAPHTAHRVFERSLEVRETRVHATEESGRYVRAWFVDHGKRSALRGTVVQSRKSLVTCVLLPYPCALLCWQAGLTLQSCVAAAWSRSTQRQVSSGRANGRPGSDVIISIIEATGKQGTDALLDPRQSVQAPRPLNISTAKPTVSHGPRAIDKHFALALGMWGFAVQILSAFS